MYDNLTDAQRQNEWAEREVSRNVLKNKRLLAAAKRAVEVLENLGGPSATSAAADLAAEVARTEHGGPA